MGGEVTETFHCGRHDGGQDGAGTCTGLVFVPSSLECVLQRYDLNKAQEELLQDRGWSTRWGSRGGWTREDRVERVRQHEDSGYVVKI